MNTLRQKCAVVILTLLLAVSAYANSGQIQCPSATSSSSDTTSTTTANVTTSIILTILSLIH